MSNYKFNETLCEEMIAWYRYFHRFPELSMQEYNTTAKIKSILNEIGIQTINLDMDVGVVGYINGSALGPEIVLRADIDALPINEESGLEFQSTVSGISHMCGHDFHISALLGAAKYLSSTKEQWKGKVKLLFQPGEETTAGAKYMIEKGAITGEEKAIFGFHNAPQLPAGVVGIRKGALFASADTIHIEIKGIKGHAGFPHLTIDATVVGSAIVMGIQTIVSRNVNPLHPAVVTVGILNSGEAHNVISDFAEIKGTIRTFSNETRSMLHTNLTRLVKQIAEGYGAMASVEIIPQTDFVNNNSDLTDDFEQAALNVVANKEIVEAEQIMATEDFSLFQELIPGTYFLVGTGDSNINVTEPWHSSKFRANESIIPLAASLLVESTLNQLKKGL